MSAPVADLFDFMGKPLGPECRSAGLATVREIAPAMTTADATTLVNKVASALEADDPYAALREATHAAPPKGASSPHPGAVPSTPAALDVTGGYRLMAALLAAKAGT